MEIVLATANPHKIEEIRRILGHRFRLVTASEAGVTEEIPEEAPTLEGNALQKARYLYRRTGRNCFADDTGLEVEALAGDPGVRSARYAGEKKDSTENMDLLLRNLEGQKNRKARFRTVIALILDGREYTFQGVVNGIIRTEKSGAGGFGYDPVFQPENFHVTFAEMDMETKNRISHRGRAMTALVEFLSALSDENL